jgi:hypothetical protein
MLIFEFTNGSIVNLLTMEALLSENGRYFLVCQSGNKYELTEEEFSIIKETFRRKLDNVVKE